jgi:hypothetical protein
MVCTTTASFCPQLPLETGHTFNQACVEIGQKQHLMFDISDFVLIERQ